MEQALNLNKLDWLEDVLRVPWSRLRRLYAVLQGT